MAHGQAGIMQTMHTAMQTTGVRRGGGGLQASRALGALGLGRSRDRAAPSLWEASHKQIGGDLGVGNTPPPPTPPTASAESQASEQAEGRQEQQCHKTETTDPLPLPHESTPGSRQRPSGCRTLAPSSQWCYEALLSLPAPGLALRPRRARPSPSAQRSHD